MTKKDIEKTVGSAFSKTAPDVLGSVLERCDEQKGSVLMNIDKKKEWRRHVLRTALIAAALAAALAVTATAASLNGLIGEEEAFVKAYEHLTLTSEDGDDIMSMVLAGTVEPLDASVVEADLGLKAGRIVYKLNFQIYDTLYHYTVDAKTGVILESSGEPAPVRQQPSLPEAEKPAGTLSADDIKVIVEKDIADNGSEVYSTAYIEEDSRENPFFTPMYRAYVSSKDDVALGYTYYVDAVSGEIIRKCMQPKMNFNPEDPVYAEAIAANRIQNEFMDRYGLTYLDSDAEEGKILFSEYLTDGTAEVFCGEAGYIYHAIIDPETLEFISEDISENPHYEGERVKAEPKEGYIGLNGAEKIAAKYYGIDADTLKGYKPAIVNYRSAEDSFDGRENYSVCFMDAFDPNGRQLYATVDCLGGEVTSHQTVSRCETVETYTPSTEAEEGRISEAVAMAVVLDSLDVELQAVHDVTVNYDGSEYAVSFTVEELGASFRVDAFGGGILCAEGPAVEKFARAE